MGRKKKYETDILISMIKEYILTKKSYKELSPSDIANYFSETHNTNIDYRHFTRNKEAVAFIEDYNQRLKEKMTKPENFPVVLKEQIIDIDEILNSCGSDQQLLRTRLEEINQYIIHLQETCRNLFGINEKLSTAEERISLLQKQVSELRDESRKEELEKQELQKKYEEQRKQNRQFSDYIKNYLYDPIMLNHLQTIGLLESTEFVAVPAGAQKITCFSNDLEQIGAFYEAIDQNTAKLENASVPEDSFQPPLEQKETYEQEILSAKETELYDKFSKL